MITVSAQGQASSQLDDLMPSEPKANNTNGNDLNKKQSGELVSFRKALSKQSSEAALSKLVDVAEIGLSNLEDAALAGSEQAEKPHKVLEQELLQQTLTQHTLPETTMTQEIMDSKPFSDARLLQKLPGQLNTVQTQNPAVLPGSLSHRVAENVQVNPGALTSVMQTEKATTQMIKGAFDLSQINRTADAAGSKVKNLSEAILNNTSSQEAGFKVSLPSASQSKAEIGQRLVSVLADKINLQANSKVNQATIRLDPPELGKLDLVVRLEGERLNIQISSTNPGVREAIAQTVERLRAELVQENYLDVNVNVGDGSQENSQFKQENAEEFTQITANNQTGIGQEAGEGLEEEVIARV